jgi:hypothetical protein
LKKRFVLLRAFKRRKQRTHLSKVAFGIFPKLSLTILITNIVYLFSKSFLVKISFFAASIKAKLSFLLFAIPFF